MDRTGSPPRIVMAIAMAALTLSGATIMIGDAHAATTGVLRVEAAATVLKPAVRIRQTGQVMFPMDPLPRCEMVRTSFGQPRSGGRTHEGLDIMANLGQDIYAVDNGVLTQQTINGAANSTLSGNAWRLTMADGTYFYYGHLSEFAPNLKQGDAVVKGQLIGKVGDTGNPGPGNYHLHFEIHPKGGTAVDPLPSLTVPAACKIYS